jgi:hypothetical protein
MSGCGNLVDDLRVIHIKSHRKFLVECWLPTDLWMTNSTLEPISSGRLGIHAQSTDLLLLRDINIEKPI